MDKTQIDILALAALLADRHKRGTARFDDTPQGRAGLCSALARKVNRTARWSGLKKIPFPSLLAEVQAIVWATISNSKKGSQP